MFVAQVPWHMALARPILDTVASVTPLAPRLVVQLQGAESHSGAIDCELALRAEEVNSLRWGLCLLSAGLCGGLCSAPAAAPHLHILT